MPWNLAFVHIAL